MGWMKAWEQQQVLTLYGVHATYRCDYCHEPILINQLHVEDPKGGYYPKETNGGDYFKGPKAKKTYHLHPCNDILRGKRKPYEEDAPPVQEKEKEEKAAPVKLGKIEKKILETMQAKPKREWKVWDVILALKNKYPPPKTRAAVRRLKESGTLVKNRGCLKIKEQ